MTFHEKLNIQVQIKDMRTILAVQGQGQKVFSEVTQELIYDNRRSIRKLQADVKEDIETLSMAKQIDKDIISKACKGWRSKRTLALDKITVEDAKKHLEKCIFNTIKALNITTHEIQKRQTNLRDLETELETLKIIYCSDQKEKQDRQMARELENKIEKMENKLHIARTIKQTYLDILNYLQDDVFYFPLRLNVLESMVRSYEKDLQSMSQVAEEAYIAQEAIKTKLSVFEKKFLADRKTREYNLFNQKKMQKEILEQKHPKGVSIILVTAQEISGRFQDQGKMEEDLSTQIEKRSKERDELLEQLREMEMQYAGLKLHHRRSMRSLEEFQNELQENLKREQERLEKVTLELSEHGKLRLLLQNATDDLFIKLYRIPPGEQLANSALECEIDQPRIFADNAEQSILSRKMENRSPSSYINNCPQAAAALDEMDIYEKLQYCEKKLRYLMESGSTMLKTTWIKDDHVEFRDVLEKTTVQKTSNQRIQFKNSVSKEAFEYEGVELDDLPTRNEIKKGSKKLVDTITRKSSKSKK
ncbi:coiled-coil domain-containing protein 183-like [Pelodytes ibericus]